MAKSVIRPLGQVSETERAMARMKSYTGQAILVFILYWFAFVPGIVANVFWHNEGKRMEVIAGQSLPGVEALGLMRRWSFVFLIVLLILLVVVFLLPLLGVR